MEKKHIVDASTGKLCLTCKRIISHNGRNYCGQFVTAHDGEYAELELVRYLRGDSCHMAWEPKTAPIIATPHGWLDVGTGKIVDVPDRPVQVEQAEGFAMGLSAGGVVRDVVECGEPARWPDEPLEGWGEGRDGSIILQIGPDGGMTAYLKGGDAGEEPK